MFTYALATARVHPRTRAEITRFFDGLHVGPGVVEIGAWRGGPRPSRTLFYGRVARKAA
jgi:S-adenosyl methyltransferase